MTEYFLVKKSIDGLRKDGEWQNVSKEAVLESFELDGKTVDLYLTREDAEASALDGADLDNDTDFFAVARVEVPDHLKGRKTEVELEDGTILETRTFNAKHVKVTDIYLSHLDESYDDINLVDVDVEAEAAEAKPAKLSILVRFMPAPSLTNAKNVLGLAGMGAAYYFGNGAVADLVVKTGYALPEAMAANPALPVAAGVVTRVAVEAPQLLMKGLVMGANLVKSTGTGIVNLCKAGKAKWDARKAAVKPAVDPDAGSAQISQLAAALEQFNDVSEKHSSSQVDKAAITYSKPADSSVSLRELIPQKATATSEGAAVKPTFH